MGRDHTPSGFRTAFPDCQGLTIARKVIVERHGGKLTFETQPGRGTTFNVRLPIAA